VLRYYAGELALSRRARLKPIVIRLDRIEPASPSERKLDQRGKNRIAPAMPDTMPCSPATLISLPGSAGSSRLPTGSHQAIAIKGLGIPAESHRAPVPPRKSARFLPPSNCVQHGPNFPYQTSGRLSQKPQCRLTLTRIIAHPSSRPGPVSPPHEPLRCRHTLPPPPSRASPALFGGALSLACGFTLVSLRYVAQRYRRHSAFASAPLPSGVPSRVFSSSPSFTRATSLFAAPCAYPLS